MEFRCSFCGKVSSEVTTLIAGSGVYICDECVSWCVVVCNEEAGPGSWGEEQAWAENKKTLRWYFKVGRVKRFAEILAGEVG